tara:strand:- start:1563 stop:1835 length:273 start_codon:yes stop_codon:yes gene_type:complete
MDDSRSKTLAVNDEEDVTNFVLYHIENELFAVDMVNDSNHILGVGRDSQPDLFLLDLMMPTKSGIQICRMIRADSKLKNTLVVFLAAKTE